MLDGSRRDNVLKDLPIYKKKKVHTAGVNYKNIRKFLNNAIRSEL